MVSSKKISVIPMGIGLLLMCGAVFASKSATDVEGAGSDLLVKQGVMDDQYREQCFGLEEYPCFYSNYYDTACTGPSANGTEPTCGCPYPDTVMTAAGDGKSEPCTLVEGPRAAVKCNGTEEGLCGPHLPCFKVAAEEPAICSCGKGFIPADDGSSCLPIADESNNECSEADKNLCSTVTGGGTCVLEVDGGKKCVCSDGSTEAVPPLAAACDAELPGSSPASPEDGLTTAAGATSPNDLGTTPPSIADDITSPTPTEIPTTSPVTTEATTSDITPKVEQQSTLTSEKSQTTSDSPSTEPSTIPEETSPTSDSGATTPQTENTVPSETDAPVVGSSSPSGENENSETPSEGLSTVPAASDNPETSPDLTTAEATSSAATTPEPAGTTVDPCVDIVCDNGGSCLDGICQCEEGWIGDQCECKDPQAADMCLSLGCEAFNDATCNAGCLEAVCNCGDGLQWNLESKKCENINECQELGAGVLCSAAGIENVACVDLDPLDEANTDKLLYVCECPMNMVSQGGTCILRDDCKDPVVIGDVTYTCGVNENELEDTCRDTVASFTCDCVDGLFISDEGAAYNEPKCIPRPSDQKDQCFDVSDYKCYYSNHYDGSCSLSGTNNDAQECTCPEVSFMEPVDADAVANGGPCQLKDSPLPIGVYVCSDAGDTKCGDHLPCYRQESLMGRERCTCKSGFMQKADGSCEQIKDGAVDSCSALDKKTCADQKAECSIDQTGLKKCTCLEGYVGNPPYGTCMASCSLKQCGDGQYCEEDTANNEAVCKCLYSWQELSLDGTCTTPDPCNTNNGSMVCAQKDQFCRFDPTNEEHYACDCYPPAVMDASGLSCRKPFLELKTYFYDMGFTVFVTAEEAEGLQNRESPVFYYFQTLLKQAFAAVDSTLAGQIVVSIGDVTEIGSSTSKPTTTTPAGQVTDAKTEGPEATTEAKTEGPEATTDAKTEGPEASTAADELTTMGAAEIQTTVGAEETTVATADTTAADEGGPRFGHRSIIIDVLMMQRISKAADVTLNLTLAVATSMEITDPNFLKEKLKQASVTTVDGESFLAFDGIYIKWDPTTVEVADAAGKDACDLYGSAQCPENYNCKADDNTVTFYVCQCNTDGLEPFGMEGNGVVQACRDIDECGRSDDERQDYCPNEEGYECWNTFGSYRCFCNDEYTDVAQSGERIDCVSKCDPRSPFGGPCSLNGGTCVIDESTKVPYCQCPSDREGVTCEEERSSSSSDTDNASVVGGVLGALLAVVLIVAGVTIYKLRKKARRGGVA